MKNRPYITALIDTYNQGRFLGEAIQSVLGQDFPADEIEILVVDDGSTDATPEVVRRYADRVRYIRKENRGQASALNLGFAEARGEIVAMLDGDDVWLPNKLGRVAAEFEAEPEAVAVCHPYIFWNPDEGVELKDQGFHPVRGRMPLTQQDLLRYGSYGTCGLALQKRLAAGIFPIPEALRIYADTYLVILVVFPGKVIGVPEHLTKYRHHQTNHTAFAARDRARAMQRWQCYARGVAEAKEWLVRQGFGLDRADVATLIRRHELTAMALRFSFEPPKREEYFSYLRDLRRLYRPLWTRRYQVYRSLLDLAGLVLGYEQFERWRGHYRVAGVSARLRERLLPVLKQEAA